MSETVNIDRALRDLYRALELELAGKGARCAACGRCCRFAEFGPELWLTSAELAFLVARHGRRAPVDGGDCPYLEDGLCAAREGRALACRTFHCELPRETVEEITNRYVDAVRRLAREADLPLEYAELSASLVRDER